MSRSFSSRPTVANQNRAADSHVGRGRARDVTMNRDHGDGSRPQQPIGVTGQPPPPQQQPQEREQRRGAYTMIAPDEKKRQSIAEKAKAETEQYERHKQQKKLGHVSYVGTVGGGKVDEGAARKASQRENRLAAATKGKRPGSFQQHRTSMKMRDQQEIDKKKAEQRRKAEENKAREVERGRNVAEEHRAQNAAFLDRIEQQNRQQRTKKVLSSSAATTAAATTAAATTATATTATAYPPTGAGAGAGALPDNQSNIDTLQRWFPRYDREVLADILSQTGGNVDLARDLLNGWNT